MNRLFLIALSIVLPLAAQDAAAPGNAAPAATPSPAAAAPAAVPAAPAANAPAPSQSAPAPSSFQGFGGEQADNDLLYAPMLPSKAWFRRTFKAEVPRYELRPPVRLNDHVVSGKLELSLKNFMDLVLVNNTDIEVTRLTVEQPRNAISRASSIFDPTILTRFTSTKQTNAATDLLAGANTVEQLTIPWQFTYNQLLSSGAQLNAGFAGQRFSTNSTLQTFNPSFNTNLNLGVTQPLLRGRGKDIVMLPITIARTRYRQSQYDMYDVVLRQLAAAQTLYWNVIEARENLKVQEKSLELADASLKRSQRELELGATSQLDIYQPQAVYANAEIFVTQARFRLANAEDALRRQIGADLDPEVRKLPLVLTEPVTIPSDMGEIDKESYITKAMRLRPDLRSDKISLDIDDLQMKQARNSLLPNIALGGGYTTTGRGGVFYPRRNLTDTGGAIVPVPGGIGDAFDQMFGFGFPIYNVSLTIQLPLRDRRAAADLADAAVARKRDLLQMRADEQTARLDVLTAINGLENSKAGVRLAQIARDLALKRADAEQKKYELGTTTIFFVLQAQGDLTAAESALVTQSVNYRRNLMLLQQRTGELLTDYGIRLP